MRIVQTQVGFAGNVMNRFRIPILALPAVLMILAAPSASGQALSVTVQGADTNFELEDLLEFDSLGPGHRVTQRLFLDFDAPEGSTVNIKAFNIVGASEFSYELEVSAGATQVANLFLYPLLIHFLPRGPGPFVATFEIVAEYKDSESGDSFDVVHTYNLVGRVPTYTLKYLIPGGQQTSVAPAGVLEFGNKPIGLPTVATVVLSNEGNGPGIIRSLDIIGDSAYSFVDPPRFPVRLEPGNHTTLQVAFTPQNLFSHTGAMVADYGAGRLQWVLAGRGGDLLSFRVVSYSPDSSTGRSQSVRSGTTISFGRDVASVEVVGTNTRSNAELIDSISLSGPFVIKDGPRLPKAVAPGESITISLEPSGTAGADRSGELLIGDAIFTLALDLPAVPALQFSSGGPSLRAGEKVPIGLSISEPYPVDIEGSLSIGIDLGGEGTAGAGWTGGGARAAFRITAGDTMATFASGATTAEFQASTVSSEITISAQLGAAPWGVDITPTPAPALEFSVSVADLPQVLFSHGGDAVGPGQQIDLGLQLAEPYPETLSGTLRLAFESKDPGSGGGQWALAGQVVQFQVMAGATQALFADGFDSTRFRAPTSEGNVTLAARFALEESGADVTPDTVPELHFAVEIPALPAVRFSRSGGTVGAAEQVSFDLELESPYSTDVIGLLSLGFETRAFSTDPSIQWSTGGAQAPFLIVAGSTDASFTGTQDATAFQTGTVAGEIVVTARFFSVPDGFTSLPTDLQAQLQAGAEITPDMSPQVRFDVMEAAPVLSRVVLGNTGQGAFVLSVTGFATARQVDSLSFTFTASSGSDLTTPQLDADVTQYFRAYYESNQSSAFGSQFTATVQFRLDDGVFEDLRQASVTASSSRGQSNSVSVTLN